MYTIKYLDGSGWTTRIKCLPSELDEAVRADVLDGDYERSSTLWVDVEVWEEDDASCIPMTVVLQPDPGKCTHRAGHVWFDDGPENVRPGSSGMGIRIFERCSHCDLLRITDTGAQRPDNGTRGHTVISYERS